jgi:hypothetical protein
MDGGIETHFFDCVGRGKGVSSEGSDTIDVENDFRMSCQRPRTRLMHSINPYSKQGAAQAFTWQETAKLSPYVDDVYMHYFRLGQITTRQDVFFIFYFFNLVKNLVWVHIFLKRRQS